MAKQRVEKLKDGTPYLAATYYEDGTELAGLWQVGYKIDGIRLIRNKDGVPCTRQGTAALPIVAYTMPQEFEDAELFRSDWGTSMSLKANTLECHATDFYSLNPIDPRLVILDRTPLTAEYIIRLRDWAMAQGYEGLVLRQDNTWIKVVPLRFADVRITGFYEGKGRLEGTLGGFTTHHGNVGGGFTDEMRRRIWDILQTNPAGLIGKILQVEFREFTRYGKLRMPVFSRFRFDKDEENLDYPVGENE